MFKPRKNKQGGVQPQLHSFLIWAIHGGEWLRYWAGRFTAWNWPLYSMNRSLNGPKSRSGRLGEENTLLPPTGIQTPDRPARSVVAIPTTLSRLPFTFYEVFSTQVVQITCVLNLSVSRRLHAGDHRTLHHSQSSRQLKTWSIVSNW